VKLKEKKNVTKQIKNEKDAFSNLEEEHGESLVNQDTTF